MTLPRILYCHCAHAQVVPKEVKEAVLARLTAAGIAFEAVADLCEMSARRDPTLQRLANSGAVRIAACYPRAVKWLFAAAQAPLATDSTEVLNMRTQSADEIVRSLLCSETVQPNLPTGKTETKAEPGPDAATPTNPSHSTSTPAPAPLASTMTN